jgi:hypothetical protein
MDIELMKRLSPRVNVIPVIGKADSFTPSELKGFKERVCDTALSLYFHRWLSLANQIPWTWFLA